MNLLTLNIIEFTDIKNCKIIEKKGEANSSEMSSIFWLFNVCTFLMEMLLKNIVLKPHVATNQLILTRICSRAGLLPKLPFKFGGSGEREKGGGVTLISSRGLNGGDTPSNEGGITLISKKKIDTGLDFDGKTAPQIVCFFFIFYDPYFMC